MHVRSAALLAVLCLGGAGNNRAAQGFVPPVSTINTLASSSPHLVLRATDDSSSSGGGGGGTVVLDKPDEVDVYAPIPTKDVEEEARKVVIIEEDDIAEALQAEAAAMADELMEEECEIDTVDDLCRDEGKRARAKKMVKNIVGSTLGLVRRGSDSTVGIDGETVDSEHLLDTGVFEGGVPEGELLERGWEQRGNSSALRRNAEVWKFALKCVFMALKPRKLRKADAPEEEIEAAKTEAATFIRDGLLRLGPTFVKLGQVVSTRTDVLPVEYTEVLKTLQDDVPGFSGARAKDIVSRELGKPCDQIFKDFSEEPLAAASLGQVHTATYKGKKVAIKVQRAGLKELFDVDLKNLKKLAVLLDKFDPKTDGADRDWVSIYEESERLLYLEIDYLNEATNAERFARDFDDIDWVRVPLFYREVSTPRVLTMEFLESFKLTNIERVEELGLDRELLAKRTADAFLRQIVETGYFHCDPHPGVSECRLLNIRILCSSQINTPSSHNNLVLSFIDRTFALIRTGTWCIMISE